MKNKANKFQKSRSIWDYNIPLAIVLIAVLFIHYLGLVSFNLDQLFLIFIAAVATLPIIWRALISLKNKKVSIDLLAGVALVFSLLAKQWTSAVFINLMITSARIFGNYTEVRSRRAIQSLFKLKPEKAKIERDGKLIEISLNDVKKGDLVVVELGERVPVDGTMEKGQAEIDQSSLTGESIPVSKKKGDQVLSSTIVVSGNLVVKAEKIGEETTLEKIIDLVEKSQANKAKINTLADKFTVGVLLFNLFLATFTYFVSSGNLNLVLAVLLVTCADDIAVGIPMAFSAAIGHAAKRGVIIKGSNFVEGLAKLKVIVADKTGTLTYGRLKVEEFFDFDAEKKQESLSLAGTVCAFSNHPSAKAIVRYLDEKDVNFGNPDSFNEQSGKGATAFYRNKKIVSGKLSFFQELNFEISDNQLRQINEVKERGLNATLIGIDDNLVGFFALADEIKPKIKETISELKRMGIEKFVMLTGDNEKIAKRIADKSGIAEWHANLLPEDKLKYLKKYLSKDYKLAMIGDGVNDAAALSLADIGIAMGVIGSDAAIEAADVALMKDDFSELPEIIKLSKYTLKIGRQDFWIWGMVNGLGLILVFSGVLAPASAAAYNFITDFIPLINSLRLFGLRFKRR